MIQTIQEFIKLGNGSIYQIAVENWIRCLSSNNFPDALSGWAACGVGLNFFKLPILKLEYLRWHYCIIMKYAVGTKSKHRIEVLLMYNFDHYYPICLTII
jgi:hypothetical protein